MCRVLRGWAVEDLRKDGRWGWFLAPVDEGSASIDDGEEGEVESMLQEADEGRRRAGAHQDSHPLPLLVRSVQQWKVEELSSQCRRS